MTGLTKRSTSVDLLRAVAIGYIVAIRHMDDYASGFFFSWWDTGLTYSFLGLFVFLSGFLLSGRYQAMDNRRAVTGFLKRRLVRIYPLYALALSLFWVLGLMDGWLYLVNLPLVGILISRTPPTLWFVSMICIYYALFPVLVYKYRPTRTILVGAGLSVAFAASTLLLSGWRPDKCLAVYLPAFVGGILAAREGRLLRVLRHWASGVASVALWLLCALLHERFVGSTKSYAFAMALTLVGLPALLALGERVSLKVPFPGMVRIVAYASFGAYLFHRIVFEVLLAVYRPSTDASVLLYLGLLGLPTVLGVALAVQWGYDRICRCFAEAGPGGPESAGSWAGPPVPLAGGEAITKPDSGRETPE